jgi:hypothetical protein
MENGSLASWEDQVIVYNAQGESVFDQRFPRDGLEKDATRQETVDLPVVPDGVNSCVVWVNVGGADPGAAPGAQGYRTGSSAMLVVGETADTQMMDEAPIYSEIQYEISSAAQADYDKDMTAKHLLKAVEAAMRLERLGEGFMSELRTAQAKLLNGLPEAEPEAWRAGAQRLMGSAAAGPDKLGDIALTLTEVVSELQPY